jgi:hypothetical protein
MRRPSSPLLQKEISMLKSVLTEFNQLKWKMKVLVLFLIFNVLALIGMAATN